MNSFKALVFSITFLTSTSVFSMNLECVPELVTGISTNRFQDSVSLYRVGQRKIVFSQKLVDGSWTVRRSDDLKNDWLECRDQYFCGTSPKGFFDGYFARKKDDSFEALITVIDRQVTSRVLVAGKCV